MADFDDDFFRKWQAGDDEARNRMWELLWHKLYTVAVRFCRGFTRNDSMAEELAAEAFTQAVLELNEKVRAGEVEWRGAPPFVAYARNRLIFRCRSQLRKHWREHQRSDALDPFTADGEEEDQALIESLDSGEASPDVTLLDRDSLLAVVTLLAAAREMCRRAKKLVEVIVCIESYLRQCVVRTAPPEVDTLAMDWEELLEVAELGELKFDKAEMYEFIRQSLGIDRNALYLRMKRLREILDGLREAEND